MKKPKSFSSPGTIAGQDQVALAAKMALIASSITEVSLTIASPSPRDNLLGIVTGGIHDFQDYLLPVLGLITLSSTSLSSAANWRGLHFNIGDLA